MGNTSWFEQVIGEANLVKTAVGSSLPLSWSAESDEDGGWDSDCKVDFVSAAGFEMMELLIFAAHLLNDLISQKHGHLNPERVQEAQIISSESITE